MKITETQLRQIIKEEIEALSLKNPELLDEAFFDSLSKGIKGLVSKFKKPEEKVSAAQEPAAKKAAVSKTAEKKTYFDNSFEQIRNFLLGKVKTLQEVDDYKAESLIFNQILSGLENLARVLAEFKVEKHEQQSAGVSSTQKESAGAVQNVIMLTGELQRKIEEIKSLKQDPRQKLSALKSEKIKLKAQISQTTQKLSESITNLLKTNVQVAARRRKLESKLSETERKLLKNKFLKEIKLQIKLAKENKLLSILV